MRRSRKEKPDKNDRLRRMRRKRKLMSNTTSETKIHKRGRVKMERVFKNDGNLIGTGAKETRNEGGH